MQVLNIFNSYIIIAYNIFKNHDVYIDRRSSFNFQFFKCENNNFNLKAHIGSFRNCGKFVIPNFENIARFSFIHPDIFCC